MARPLAVARDMSTAPCSKVAATISAFMKDDKSANAKPERDALWFYGANHGVSLIKQQFLNLEPLDNEAQSFMNVYHERLCPAAIRAFYYLTLICVRETRHVQLAYGMEKSMQTQFGA